jgi:hypothetical protein
VEVIFGGSNPQKVWLMAPNCPTQHRFSMKGLARPGRNIASYAAFDRHFEADCRSLPNITDRMAKAARALIEKRRAAGGVEKGHDTQPGASVIAPRKKTIGREPDRFGFQLRLYMCETYPDEYHAGDAATLSALAKKARLG